MSLNIITKFDFTVDVQNKFLFIENEELLFFGNNFRTVKIKLRMSDDTRLPVVNIAKVKEIASSSYNGISNELTNSFEETWKHFSEIKSKKH